MIFIDAPGTATSGNGGIPVYGPFPNGSPVGGNFVQADGNPVFESGFNQSISGLTPRQTYTLSFYQSGGQQLGFGNGQPTTEQWIVSLGTVGLSVSTSGGRVDPVYSPSLKAQLPELLPVAYARARRQAATETGLPVETVPATCEWSVDEILGE